MAGRPPPPSPACARNRRSSGEGRDVQRRAHRPHRPLRRPIHPCPPPPIHPHRSIRRCSPHPIRRRPPPPIRRCPPPPIRRRPCLLHRPCPPIPPRLRHRPQRPRRPPCQTAAGWPPSCNGAPWPGPPPNRSQPRTGARSGGRPSRSCDLVYHVYKLGVTPVRGPRLAVGHVAKFML